MQQALALFMLTILGDLEEDATLPAYTDEILKLSMTNYGKGRGVVKKNPCTHYMRKDYYGEVKNNPVLFKKLIRLEVQEFDHICSELGKLYKERVLEETKIRYAS